MRKLTAQLVSIMVQQVETSHPSGTRNSSGTQPRRYHGERKATKVDEGRLTVDITRPSDANSLFFLE